MLTAYEIKKLLKNRILFRVAAAAVIVCIISAFRISVSLPHEQNVTPEKRNGDFTAAMSRFIRESEKGLSNAGDDADKYTVEYYNECIAAFGAAREKVTLTTDDAEGWGALIGFDMLFYVSVISAAVIGAVSFCEDRRTGAGLIINSARNGGARCAFSRVAASVSASLIFFALYSVISVISFAVFSSLKGGGLPLQTAVPFRYSPFLYTLRGTFLRLTARRALSVVFVTLLSVLCSAALNGYVPVLISASVIPAAEFALFSATYHAVDVFAQNVNLFAYGTSYLFKKYYTVRLSGCALPQKVTPVLLAALCAALVAAIIPVYGLRRRAVSGSSRLGRLLRRIPLPAPRARKRPVFYWELRKSVLRPPIFILTAVCLVIGLTSVVRSAPKGVGMGGDVYREMCETASGMTLGQTGEWLTAIEELDLSESPDEEDEAYADYIKKELMQMQVRRFRERIETIRKYEKLGKVRILFERGFTALFSSDLNVFALAAIIAVCSGLFSYDRETGSYPAVRTSRGRRRSFLIRITVAAGFAALVHIAFFTVRYAVLCPLGVGEHHDVLFASVLQDTAASAVTIGGYITSSFFLGLVSSVAFAVAVASVSALSGKTLFTLAFSFAAGLVPYALRRTGGFPLYADVSAFMAGNPALQAEGYRAFAALAPMVLISAALTVAAYVRENKG